MEAEAKDLNGLSAIQVLFSIQWTPKCFTLHIVIYTLVVMSYWIVATIVQGYSGRDEAAMYRQHLLGTLTTFNRHDG